MERPALSKASGVSELQSNLPKAGMLMDFTAHSFRRESSVGSKGKRKSQQRIMVLGKMHVVVDVF